MYDPLTLDQLRAFVAVVDAGSFSAAARSLHRVQSAVSTAMANLENQLGLALWDRSTKVARLTEAGQALLISARRVLREVDALRRLASGMQTGLEPQVSLCVDALFPLPVLVAICRDFAQAFPTVALRVDTQTLRVVSTRVSAGHATLGVVSPGGVVQGLEQQVLSAIRMRPVVAPEHPLAQLPSPIPTAALADCVQIVLSERDDSALPDQAVLSPHTWRVTDLHTKHVMLRAGLGWGNMPEHTVRDDLAQGLLRTIAPAAWGVDEHTLQLSAVYRSDTALGPAHHWLLARLKQLCAAHTLSA